MWKVAKEALARLAPKRDRKKAAKGHPDALKAQRAGPSAEQRDLSEGWYHVLRGRFVKATTTPPKIIKTSQLVTEAPKQHKVTITSKTGRPKRPQPKSRPATKPAPGEPKKKAASVKTSDG
jgi:hypothetical protein